MTTLTKGTRVETTGYGRTASWGRYVGTVTRVTKRAIYVVWDKAPSLNDEMSPREVKKLDGAMETT